MKKITIYLVAGLLVSSLFFYKTTIADFYHNSVSESLRPIEKDEFGQEKDEEAKNQPWTVEQATEYNANMDLVRQTIALGRNRLGASKRLSAFTDVATLGTWFNVGPYNMPGAFQFCEVDETTDDVYAVTCGHLTQAQYIWKGTLAGDNWKCINPKNPGRFEEIFTVPVGSIRRVVAAQEKGKIMYSDDEGATWTFSSGISGGIRSTIVNTQDNYVIYATDSEKVYRSTDKGATFSEFYTIPQATIAVNSRLYSPRYDNQPNADDVYLLADGQFFKLKADKSTFYLVNANAPTMGAIKKVILGGDSRKLWLVLGDRVWYYSTDSGLTFNFQGTSGLDYSGTNTNGTYSGQTVGASPENPNILLGGYVMFQSTQNGWGTNNDDLFNYWSKYQTNDGDQRKRVNYHPDVQASQFFYDRSGKLLSLRSTDGGVFKSYDEWTKTSYPTVADAQSVFYNISLYNHPVQETYPSSFILGKNNINDMSMGTQDQGDQRSRLNSYANPTLSFDQVTAGDGVKQVTGDGTIGWSVRNIYTTDLIRISLYGSSGTYYGYSGSADRQTISAPAFNTISMVGDWNYGDRMWFLGKYLRRVVYNPSTYTFTAKDDNLTGTANAFNAIAQSRKTPSVVYAMQDGKVFKSTNTGDTWTDTNSNTGIVGSTFPYGAGWSSPLDENIVLFATTSGSAVKSVFSKDGGATWTDVTGTGANLFFPGEVHGLAGTEDGKLVFASTKFGPYVFIVSEEKWYPLAVQANVPLFNGKYMYVRKYGTKEYAFFSTWGQGIWRFEINSAALAIAKNKADDLTFRVFPNPTSDFVYLNLGNEFNFENLEIGIYNQSGQLVKRDIRNYITGMSVDLRDLPNGIYFLNVKSKNSDKTQKIIVKH